jgi:hypothetical protein
LQASRSSFWISGYAAIASFDSLVKGTQTLATWTMTVTGPLGSEPRDWLRP